MSSTTEPVAHATPQQKLRAILHYASNKMLRRGASTVLSRDIASGDVIEFTPEDIDHALARLNVPAGAEGYCPGCYHAFDACAHCSTYTGETPADKAARLGEESDRSYRAAGDCLCPCGREYRRHPFTEHRSNFDAPYLHRLCNGDIVKL